MNSTPLALLADGSVHPTTSGLPDTLNPTPTPKSPREPDRMTPFAIHDSTRSDNRSEAPNRHLLGLCTVFAASIPLVLGGFLAGCGQTSTTSVRDRRGPAALTVEADWDAIDAAVEVGASQGEAAVLRSSTSPDGLQKRYELKHISGLTGVLHAKVESDGKDPRAISLRCTMGAMENGGIAQTIVDRVSRRLRDLKGKSVAPIRE